MAGWFKCDRDLIDGGLIKDHNTFIVFMYLIGRANLECKQWEGVPIQRGQIATGRKILSEAIGISEKQVRLSLDKLKKRKLISSERKSSFSIITVCNYDQDLNKKGPTKGPTLPLEIISKRANTLPQQTHTESVVSKIDSKKGPTENKKKGQHFRSRRATTKEYKEKEERNNKEIFPFKDSLIQLGAKQNLVSEWITVRKKKKASNTETALNGFKREVDASGMDINKVLQMCVERSWGGFKYEWVRESTKQQEPTIKLLE